MSKKRIQIVTGHYGSGKTEYAVNLALSLAVAGKKTVLADLDIVNPYFRSYEKSEQLEAAGIRVIVTSCGGVADIPAIGPEILSVFQDQSITGVLDIGGDPIGARVLARFAPYLKEEDFDLLYLVNANRPETGDLKSALAYLHGIEAECGQKVTGIVNNTHLCGETTVNEIRKGAELATKLSEQTGIPIIHHAVERKLVPLIREDIPIFPMDIYMKKPWEITTMEEENLSWPEK